MSDRDSVLSATVPGAAPSASLPDAALQHGDVQPVVFNDCLGWIHAPKGPGVRNAGVVIVNGVGRDGRCAYRALRLLAESLADAGFTVLRYDHPGEGDSLPPGDGQLFTAWRAGVQAAVQALKAASGLERVALVGVRLGGSLAAMNADGVDAQVLLAPVVSGRQWLRELKMAGRISGTLHEGQDGRFESEGLTLPRDCVAAIQGLDLHKTPAFAPAVLLALPRGADPHLEGAFAADGVQGDRIAFDDFELMMADSHSNRPPLETFAAVVAWLSDRYATSPRKAQNGAAKTATLYPTGAREIAVTLGRGLKGVLCVPEAAAASGKAVVFCNTGGDPRAGIGGFAAASARRLALNGTASLRFDFAGLGDSAESGDGEGHVFATSRAADFDAAVSLLEQLGYADLTLVGVCSGAVHALNAAFDDPRICRLLIVNPITLTWGGGHSIEALYRTLAKSTHGYLRASSRIDTWRRLLTGRINLGIVGRALAGRALARVSRVKRAAHDQHLRAGIARMARRGAKLQVLVGVNDGTLDEVETHFGRRGRHLTRLGMSLTINPALDHGLSLEASRAIALDMLVELVGG